MEKNQPGKPQPQRDEPVYTIGVVARLLGVHHRTLRIYEEEGLIKPARVGNRRMYSANDLTWLGCLRRLIHDEKISIAGIKKLLHYAPCYEIADCPEEVHCTCDAVVDRAISRDLRVLGDQNKRIERDHTVRKKSPRADFSPSHKEKKSGGAA